MMGTSLLAMPWGILTAGLVFGPFLFILMGAIACATAIAILELHKRKSKFAVN